MGIQHRQQKQFFKFMLIILGTMVEMNRKLTVEQIRKNLGKAKIYGTKTGSPSRSLAMVGTGPFL